MYLCVCVHVSICLRPLFIHLDDVCDVPCHVCVLCLRPLFIHLRPQSIHVDDACQVP